MFRTQLYTRTKLWQTQFAGLHTYDFWSDYAIWSYFTKCSLLLQVEGGVC